MGRPTTIRIAALLCIALVVAGCTIRLIAEYDESTDQGVTTFQRKIETVLTSLERQVGTDAAAYANYVKSYDELRVDLRVLRARATAIPKNDRTVEMLTLLTDNLAKMEQLHQRGLSAQDIPPLRTAFNEACTAILKLEIAKKRS
jgi:hypothetical protein